jgi:hypothetical protein
MNRFYVIVIIIIAAAGLMLPAFYNGYPLVYSDTGTYIASGFEGKVPNSRPITYGLFIRHSSLAASLWLCIFIQCITLSGLLYYFTNKVILNRNTTKWYFLGITLALILLSSLPWFTSMLMADFFTPISYLLLFILLFDTPKNKLVLGGLALVYLYTTSTHLTHAPAHLFLAFGMAFIKLFKGNIFSILTWRKLAYGLVLILMNFIFLSIIHFCYHGGFKSSQSGHIFITARMIESGAMKAVLDDNCATKNNLFCAYKDSLPNNGSEFLWLPESILYKLGGWESNEQEFKALNKTIFQTPKYLKIYLSHFFRVLKFHLLEHNVGEELIVLGANSPPGWEIDAHFKSELPQLIASKQANGFWYNKLNGLNQLIEIVLILSILISCYLLFFTHASAYLKIFSICFFFVYLGNMLAVCIASSGSRYNARLDWLLVFIAILLLIENRTIAARGTLN